jgi:hypothetical protein
MLLGHFAGGCWAGRTLWPVSATAYCKAVVTREEEQNVFRRGGFFQNLMKMKKKKKNSMV